VEPSGLGARVHDADGEDPGRSPADSARAGRHQTQQDVRRAPAGLMARRRLSTPLLRRGVLPRNRRAALVARYDSPKPCSRDMDMDTHMNIHVDIFMDIRLFYGPLNIDTFMAMNEYPLKP